MGLTELLLILSSCSLAPPEPKLNSSAISKALNGVWTNQENSTLVLKVSSDTQQPWYRLEGLYISGVANSKGTYYLEGRGSSRGSTLIFGWQIIWNNHIKHNQSITSWNVLFDLTGDQTRFRADYILTVPSTQSSNSAYSGQDYFTRTPTGFIIF